MSDAVVAIGTSFGGLMALKRILPQLPAALPCPVIIVQHRSASHPHGMLEVVSAGCAMPMSEPEDKTKLEPGKAYLAPAGYHLLVEHASFSLSTEARVCCARPSIDVLFESAALAFGTGVLGVVLTGANSDGAEGAVRIAECGGTVFVQDPDGAASRVMPDAALTACATAERMSLDAVAQRIRTWCAERAR